MQDSLLRAAFEQSLREVDPQKLVPGFLPSAPRGRTIVVGAGKAAASMARAVEMHWLGELSGLVVTRHGHAVACDRVEVVEAAHPVPDDAGLAAARQMMKLVSGLTQDDLVIALFSGGGSSLVPLPAGRVTLEDKKSLTGQLLRAGASVTEINCVRKHLSAIKGGRLARACEPATVVNLLISDVVGDDPSAIASGPGVPDTSTLADARDVLEKYDLQASEAVLEHLSLAENESPKPAERRFDRVSSTIVASSQTMLEAAARFFAGRNIPPLIISSSVEGESTDVALVHAAMARQIAYHSQPVSAPCVLLSGGETTVTIRGPGCGGPNCEFLLALVLALGDDVDYVAIACDTDGIDGAGEAAGAVAHTGSLRRATSAGLDARRMLRANDSQSFFGRLGDLVVTGPTRNNVNDFRALLVLNASHSGSARPPVFT